MYLSVLPCLCAVLQLVSVVSYDYILFQFSSCAFTAAVSVALFVYHEFKNVLNVKLILYKCIVKSFLCRYW